MPLRTQLRGAGLGLAAAALFGVSAPFAKLLLPQSNPLVLAALLYLGGGLGLVCFGLARGLFVPRGASTEAALSRNDWPLLAAITVIGGMVGPVLMLNGLSRLSGVATSLLLNLEGPFTVLVAVVAFREHLGRMGIIATALTFIGAALIGFSPGAWRADVPGALCVVAACLAWALDNNLTQRLSLRDPIAVVRIKTLGAGALMLMIALVSGQQLPSGGGIVRAVLLGSAAYGLSIVLDMKALRILGAAREAAFFATAPFIGALASVPLLGEQLRALHLAAGGVMATGVVLLLRERHGHSHTHEPLEHDHLHFHDEHHGHVHEGHVAEPHSHPHRHAPLTHDHPHLPDLHHRHRHGR